MLFAAVAVQRNAACELCGVALINEVNVKMETDKIKSTIKKMENVFLKAGFEWQIINDERYLVYRENFCQITYVHGLSAYVIEATNNRREAENGVLEDGELYPDDMPEQEL